MRAATANDDDDVIWGPFQTNCFFELWVEKRLETPFWLMSKLSIFAGLDNLKSKQMVFKAYVSNWIGPQNDMQACEHSHRHFEGGGALARCPSPLCPPARNRHHSPPTRFIYSRFVHIRAAVWHSTWIICSLLSQFCFSNFQTFSLSYWRANSYYPRLKMGKWNSPNLSETLGFSA